MYRTNGDLFSDEASWLSPYEVTSLAFFVAYRVSHSQVGPKAAQAHPN